MKKLFFLLAFGFVASCTSTDDDSNDGKCWGAIRDYAPDGTLDSEVRFKRDCSECGTQVYWVCPEPGTCEYNDALGLFECD